MGLAIVVAFSGSALRSAVVGSAEGITPIVVAPGAVLTRGLGVAVAGVWCFIAGAGARGIARKELGRRVTLSRVGSATVVIGGAALVPTLGSALVASAGAVFLLVVMRVGRVPVVTNVDKMSTEVRLFGVPRGLPINDTHLFDSVAPNLALEPSEQSVLDERFAFCALPLVEL